VLRFARDTSSGSGSGIPESAKTDGMAASKSSDSGGRADRLAAALKANLKRRKAQARGRAEGAESPIEREPASGEKDERPGAHDREES
jgi:hypothetical protein